MQTPAIVNVLKYPPGTKPLSIDVSFSCVCPVSDRAFRHNIVKVAVDPRGDSRVGITHEIGCK